MEKELVLYRVSEPNILDTAPYGTQCIVNHDNKKTVYIQVSHDEENPIWREEEITTF